MSGPQRFHHREFTDLPRLLAWKAAGRHRISVCIPTLNEAATIGTIVETIRSSLMTGSSLVDELLVIDSDSSDATRELALEAGARVFPASAIAPGLPACSGKGENLWKALHVATGDIICYVDGDIANFHPRFVTGLIGPLLADPRLDYVKAFYERPLTHGAETRANGGGRVSEILVRPLLSLFYPELTGILQPLSGEYAARRSLLESLHFPCGYGVEIAHLIDIAAAGKLPGLAQTDLDQRIHRNRDEASLGHMAFAILRTLFRRLERDGKLTLTTDLPETHRSWAADALGLREVLTRIPDPERPPFHQWQAAALTPAP